MDLFQELIKLLLIIGRMGGLFLALPLFNSRNIPVQIKIGFIFFTSYILLPMVNMTVEIPYESMMRLITLFTMEVLVGVAFGFISYLMLTAFYFAGLLVDRDLGYAMVNVISPQADGEIPMTANIYYIIAMVLFLGLNMHHYLIEAIYRSYESIPIGQVPNLLIMVKSQLGLLQDAIIIGFKIASPIVITALVANVVLGLLAKAMPGMNVFMVGMPFKILVGVMVLILITPLYGDIFKDVFLKMRDAIELLLR